MRLWGRILTNGRERPASRIEIADGRIVAIETAATPAPGTEVSVEEGWIAPGLIDLQVNGAGGVDLTSAEDPEAALAHVARTLAAHGVTAFCPTIVSSPLRVITRCLRAYGPRTTDGGAESLGLHVEGPFIDPEHRGVHDLSNVRTASTEEIDAWLENGVPAIVTVAPEQQGAIEAIAQLGARGVVVSLGHSGADAETACAALDAGARMATHLFNGMPPLHHRRPGLVGALLAREDATLGLITDGVHVHPLMVDLVVRRCGTNRVALVSDALAPAGGPPGESRLGEQSIVSDGRSVRRTDGTLAGSAMLLDGILRNVRAWFADLEPATLVLMCTQTPADLLGVRSKGRVVVGCDADLIVLDHDFNVVRTILRGTYEPA
jgi:N-acetylglucosamine-6-phosphate deacetylase